VKQQPRPSEDPLREALVREKGDVAALVCHFDRDRASIGNELRKARAFEHLERVSARELVMRFARGVMPALE